MVTMETGTFAGTLNEMTGVGSLLDILKKKLSSLHGNAIRLKRNMFYQASVLFVLDFAQLNHTESQQVCLSLMSHVSKCAIVIHCPLSWMKTLQVVAGNPLHLGHLQVNPCGRHHFLEAVFCTDLRESKWCVKNVDSNQCMNFLKHVPTISCHFRQMFIPYLIQVESSIYFTVHYLE